MLILLAIPTTRAEPLYTVREVKGLRVGGSCLWWSVGFRTRVDGVIVDPLVLPTNRVNVTSLQLPTAEFRVLDVDPRPWSVIDVVHGFELTFQQLPEYSEMSIITAAVTDIYRTGRVNYGRPV